MKQKPQELSKTQHLRYYNYERFHLSYWMQKIVIQNNIENVKVNGKIKYVNKYVENIADDDIFVFFIFSTKE